MQALAAVACLVLLALLVGVFITRVSCEVSADRPHNCVLVEAWR